MASMRGFCLPDIFSSRSPFCMVVGDCMLKDRVKVMSKHIENVAFLVLLLATGSTALALPMSFTDRAAFDAALSELSVSTEGFEGVADGTVITDGGSLGDITFNFPTLSGFGVNMLVTGAFPAPSGVNTLGTDDGDVFQDSDDFDISFAAANAIGMFVVSVDPLIDGDFELTAGGMTASLLTADLFATLSDGSAVYFLGIVDTAATFSQASVTTSHTPGNFFTWNVDDIVTAREQAPTVPVPGVPLLLATGLLGLAVRRHLV